MRSGYRVAILPPGSSADPLAATASIIVFDYDSHPTRVLGPDGVWREAHEGSIPQATVVLPAEALDALVDAVDRYRGAPSHAKTEAAVLREWLAKEQSRVDEVFRAVGQPIVFADKP